jgi:hypothetical protein
MKFFWRLLQVDAKVIDAVKRIKSLPVMKKSLEKLLAEAEAAADSKPQPKVEQTKKAPGLNVINFLRL